MVRYILVENDDKLTVRYENDELWKTLQAQMTLLQAGIETHLYKIADQISQLKLGDFDA